VLISNITGYFGGIKSSVVGILWVLVAIFPTAVLANETVRVAVASNFIKPLQALRVLFEKKHGYNFVIVSGSTGKLYAQILFGAPYDIFLAADTKTPERLVAQGIAVSQSQFIYARGQLVLWGRDKPALGTSGREMLERHKFRYIAIANPKLAPYGKGAMEVLTRLKIADQLKSQLVRGESIAQAFQFISSGNADVGFVALSQVMYDAKGGFWQIPLDWYEPIEQQAVLLKYGQHKVGAQAFIKFLQSDVARTIMIERFGYL